MNVDRYELTKDGIKVRKGDTIYHPAYYPSAIVADIGGKLMARIPMCGVEPISECFVTDIHKASRWRI